MQRFRFALVVLGNRVDEWFLLPITAPQGDTLAFSPLVVRVLPIA